MNFMLYSNKLSMYNIYLFICYFILTKKNQYMYNVSDIIKSVTTIYAHCWQCPTFLIHSNIKLTIAFQNIEKCCSKLQILLNSS